MNEYHKYLEKWIKNIEETGADGDFFTYLDEDEINCTIRRLKERKKDE